MRNREPKHTHRDFLKEGQQAGFPHVLLAKGLGQAESPAGSAPAWESQAHSQHLLGARPRAGSRQGELAVQTGERLTRGKRNQVGCKPSHGTSAQKKQHTDAN